MSSGSLELAHPTCDSVSHTKLCCVENLLLYAEVQQLILHYSHSAFLREKLAMLLYWSYEEPM